MSGFGRAFSAFWRGLFFGGNGVVGAVPHARRDGPIEGERHHQDEPGEALGVTDLGIFQAEAPGFEVREHGLDAPTQAVVQGLVARRRLAQCDDPGFVVTGLLDDGDVGGNGVPPIYLIRGALRTPTGPPVLVLAPSSL